LNLQKIASRRFDTADENPNGGLYNTTIWFLSVFGAPGGLVYGKNVLQGDPLAADIGDGPFIAHPLAVGRLVSRVS
jgi:hypothetical protein